MPRWGLMAAASPSGEFSGQGLSEVKWRRAISTPSGLWGCMDGELETDGINTGGSSITGSSHTCVHLKFPTTCTLEGISASPLTS